ncbi:MAG: metallophosphoesterase [Pirellulales bacterium]|nr:metallophosphoesterase [Pirellulales bacterium]
MSVVLLSLAVATAMLGHAALWIGLINRFHAIGASRVIVKVASVIGYGILCFTPFVYFVEWWATGGATQAWAWSRIPGAAWGYFVLCWILAVAVAVVWIRRQWIAMPPRQVLSRQTIVVDVAEQLSRKPLFGWQAKLLSYFPGNEVLKIAIEELEIEIERLPSNLDGFSIVQLSDWHFTGKIGLEYFREVVREANSLHADLVALCGDLIENAERLDWIAETFQQLRARYGTYFVLGNHDIINGDVPKLRQMLADAGLVNLGGSWRRIDVDGVEIILAGNELPWITPAAEMSDCSPRSLELNQFRILLSHSPDQFGWARHWDFDLMLAGHTHGGQIRLPLVGPIASPSLHGVKYASGTFYTAPTLMHVSRGISAKEPIRLNCPPELAHLVLRCPSRGQVG